MDPDNFKPSYNRFLPGSTPEQATVTSRTNIPLRDPVNPFSATRIPFPIFHFKAKPAKPVEVKPKKVKKVNAEKGKKGTDDITKYFVKSARVTPCTDLC